MSLHSRVPHEHWLLAVGLLVLFGLWTGFGVEGVEAVAEGKDEQSADQSGPMITHGPILGRPGSHQMGVWARTSVPARLTVRYRLVGADHLQSATDSTHRRNDNTGWVRLTGLRPDTTYAYRVMAGTEGKGRSGTFRTLPSAEQRRHPKYNPEGLFNFSFEHGSCNFQYRRGDTSYAMPAYQSMLNRADRIDFQIMNGDFIYEEERGRSVDTWQQRQGGAPIPEIVQDMPGLVGVWANYKTYLDRASYLTEWHRTVPAYFMFDDHELLNDINGAGTPGHRGRATVYRDIGVAGWQDYLGWSNPTPPDSSPIHHGRATITAEGLLRDTTASFTSSVASRPTLHVHWNDDHPAAGVYKVDRVVNEHRLSLSPTPRAEGHRLHYSIGRRSYYKFRVSNAAFFVLDTRSHRDVHDKQRPAKEGVSMLGATQRRWLKRQMRQSDADVFFVVSTVSLSIPHVSPSDSAKDESWTSYLAERKDLISFWDGLDAPVLVLTGDLHNSMAVNVSDNVREYLSGPHNSPNHDYSKEAYRPPSGPFNSNDRTVDIQWSSFWLDDVPGRVLQQPHYSVISVNNVVNNPASDGSDRWVAYPEPQVVVQFYDGLTGELLYAESVTVDATTSPAFDSSSTSQ